MWFIRDSLGVCNGDFPLAPRLVVKFAKVDIGALTREPHIEFAL